MPKGEEPPFLGSSVHHSPYTVEGQIEQWGSLRKARGWRRTAVRGFVFCLLLLSLVTLIAGLFQARS